MFNKKNPVNYPGLDEAIELAIAELKLHDPNTKEYAETVTQIERLNALKTSGQKSDSFSKDGILAVAGNLLGIGLILSYEHIHPITSKALGFVTKSRV